MISLGVPRCLRCGRRKSAEIDACSFDGTRGSAAPSFAFDEPDEALDIAGYRMLGVLGRGGFGTVFEAEGQADGHRVAIKVSRRDRPQAAERLEQEAAALRIIGPPHVPTVYGAGVCDGGFYVVLELLACR